MPVDLEGSRSTIRSLMKAVVVEQYTPIGDVGLKGIPKPSIAPGLLRVRVLAAGIGFVDGLKVQGLYQTKDPLPFIPGSEFSGVIDEVADNVAEYAPGISVMGHARSARLRSTSRCQPKRCTL
jgi:NADPH2:quinone reductase